MYTYTSKSITKHFRRVFTKVSTSTPLNTIPKLNFSTGVQVNQGNTQVATPPTKTKEQLKVESLMQQWPEYLRNPPKGSYELENAKLIYEELYKYHQGDKKYMGSLDLPKEFSSDFLAVVNQCLTTDSIADFFVKYEGFLPDHFIMAKFKQIAMTHKDVTSDMYDIILPQVKKLIINADRQTAKNLYIAVVSGSHLNINDVEYWDMLEFKLMNERLYRYLELKDAAEVAFHLVKMRKGSKALLKQLEIYFIKHRKGVSLDKQIVNLVASTYSICGCSPTLIAALEDPTIEVPDIDPKIPKMDKVPFGDSKRPALENSKHQAKMIPNHH